jgi:DNA-binding transcriptional MerR regulator
MTTTEMTIDELARAAGLAVSTVRLYQNRSLLRPPSKRGRVGYYDESHLARLGLIAELQGRGFSLAAIKELFDGMDRGESLRAVLGLGDTPSTWTPEQPVSMTLQELADALPHAELTPDVVRRVLELDLVTLGDDGTVTMSQPSFLEIGGALGRLGVPNDDILDEYERLRGDATAIATRFTEVFRKHLWEPAVAQGLPAERIAELVAGLEELGPLAEAVVVTTLRQALQAMAETFIAAEAERLSIDLPRPGDRARTDRTA